MKANIEFSKSIQINPEKKSEAEQMVEEYNGADRAYPEDNKPCVLTEEERKIVSALIIKVGEKLKTMGIEDAIELLPSIADIDFFKDVSPFYGVLHTASIEIGIPGEKFKNDPIVRYIFFHELSHFITQKIYQDKRGFLERTQVGYDRIVSGNWRGIYEESSAELFGLYCLDEEADVPSLYPIQTAFVIALLNKFAENRNLSPLQVFKQFYCAKIARDYSFQGELKEEFGIDLVRGINKISKVNGSRRDSFTLNQLQLLSQKGGFAEEYVKLLNAFVSGESVGFADLKGKLKIMDTEEVPYGWEVEALREFMSYSGLIILNTPKVPVRSRHESFLSSSQP